MPGGCLFAMSAFVILPAKPAKPGGIHLAVLCGAAKGSGVHSKSCTDSIECATASCTALSCATKVARKRLSNTTRVNSDGFKNRHFVVNVGSFWLRMTLS